MPLSRNHKTILESESVERFIHSEKRRQFKALRFLRSKLLKIVELTPEKLIVLPLPVCPTYNEELAACYGGSPNIVQKFQHFLNDECDKMGVAKMYKNEAQTR